MPRKALKDLPAFKTEAEERTLWRTHDATDYLDLSKAQRVTFSNLKPSGRDEVISNFQIEETAMEPGTVRGCFTDFKI